MVVPVFPHFVSPNEFTRWLLAASLVEDRTVEVSKAARLLGTRFEDLSERDGRLYSNKAPGLAIVALPGYLAGRAVAGPPSPESMRLVVTAMRLVGSTLPLILLAFLFLKLGGEKSATALWILLFATPLFAYGLLLFSHAIVAASLFGAWAALFAFKKRFGLIAGALIGLATCCEYPAAIAGLIFVIGLLAARSWRTTATTIAGGIPFAIALGVYNYIAFGSPFTLSTWYDRLPEYRELGRTALFGVQMPSIDALIGLLFDPGRGLLVFSPVLLLAIPGLIAARRALAPAAFWTLLATPLTIIIFYSGYPNWHGGWALGPRYIVSAIPFLVFPLIYRDSGVIDALLAGWSVAANVITALVFPFVPVGFIVPWSSLSIPLLRDGLIAPNLFHLAARPLALAVPFLIVAVSMALVFRRTRTIFAAIGLVVALALGHVVDLSWTSPLHVLQRTYIAEVYFERRGALEKQFPGIAVTQPRLLLRRDAELAVPPDFWPF